jgi:streptogramin lyase
MRAKISLMRPNIRASVTRFCVPRQPDSIYDSHRPDKDNNMWIADGAMGGAIIKFDQKTEKFTFYPAVQRGDLPKIEITRDGAIWYNPRSALKGAVGVLYPDMTKMTGFDARY